MIQLIPFMPCIVFVLEIITKGIIFITYHITCCLIVPFHLLISSFLPWGWIQHSKVMRNKIHRFPDEMLMPSLQVDFQRIFWSDSPRAVSKFDWGMIFGDQEFLRCVLDNIHEELRRERFGTSNSQNFRFWMLLNRDGYRKIADYYCNLRCFRCLSWFMSLMWLWICWPKFFPRFNTGRGIVPLWHETRDEEGRSCGSQWYAP